MTPLEMLQANVADYRSGKKDGPTFLTALTETEPFVHGYVLQLQSMGDADDESLQRLRQGGESKFQEAIGQLRKALESGDMSLCDAALRLAEQGDFLFNEVLSRLLG